MIITFPTRAEQTAVCASPEAIDAFRAATSLTDRLVAFSERFQVLELRDPGNRANLEFMTIDEAVTRLLSTDLRTLPAPGRVIWALGSTDPAKYVPLPGRARR